MPLCLRTFVAEPRCDTTCGTGMIVGDYKLELLGPYSFVTLDPTWPNCFFWVEHGKPGSFLSKRHSNFAEGVHGDARAFQTRVRSAILSFCTRAQWTLMHRKSRSTAFNPRYALLTHSSLLTRSPSSRSCCGSAWSVFERGW